MTTIFILLGLLMGILALSFVAGNCLNHFADRDDDDQ